MAKALIIDDNATNILVLQQLLVLEDVTCVTINSTKELATQLNSIKHVDVVFLDLEMPVIDGYDAIKLIKEHPNFNTARCVAYSVHVSELHTALDMGFDAFLGKPINAEEFPEQFERILRGEQVCYLP